MSNPRKLKLVPLDAAQLPRSLDDLTAAAINNDYADQAGLVPARDAIGREAADGPYANLIAVRAKDRDQPWVRSWWRLTSRPRSAPSSRKNSRARWCPRSDASGSLFRIPDIRRHTMSIITLAGSPSQRSRSSALLRHAANRLRAGGWNIGELGLRDIPAEELIEGHYASPPPARCAPASRPPTRC